MKKNSFVEGTVIATAIIVLVKIIGMLYVIPFYAIIGQKGSALYGYGYNIYLIFLGISSAGIPTAISKITNEYQTLGYFEAKKRAFEIGLKIISLVSVIIFLVLFIFAKPVASLIIGNLQGGNTIDDVALIVRCVSPAILVVPFLSVSKGYLQGHKFISTSSTSQLIEQIVRVAIILIGSYLCIKVFKTSTSFAVGVAILGAFFAGLVAYLYILKKITKNKKELSLTKTEKKDKISNKVILKKIATYAVPFIIISVATNIYNFIDMVLILRTLTHLGYDAATVEFVTSAITTWSCKLSMIVVAIANGMIVSLIPNIVGAFTLKKWGEVNKKLNQALQIILFVSIPLVLGLSFLATPVWKIFYGNNIYGPIVLKVSIINALFTNLYMVTSSTLQGLNKFKLVYKTTLSGFILNMILDVPMMLLFNKLGLYAFHGALVSTAIGYIVSTTVGLYSLKKENNLSYKDTYQTFLKILVPTICMVIVLYITKIFLPFNNLSKTKSLLYIIIYAVLGGITYIAISIKMKLFNQVLGNNFINKVKKKLIKR